MFCIRESVPESSIQQNDKSTQKYQRTIWIRSHSTIVLMGEKHYKSQQLQESQNLHLRCLGLNLIPVSIRLKPVASKQHIIPSARKIIEKAEKQLLQDRVRGINKTIQDSEDQVN